VNDTKFTSVQVGSNRFLKFIITRLDSSVEHDPVSGSRSNRILHFRSGLGLDWILKKTQPD